MVPGCNIAVVTGRTHCSVVMLCLLVGFCLCEPLHAGQDSRNAELQQSHTRGQDLETLRRTAEQRDSDAPATRGAIFEGIILPRFHPEAVWLSPAPKQEGPGAQVGLVSAGFNLHELFENFDIHRGPVPDRVPTHTDMIAVTTPLEFSAPAAISFDVIGLTWKDR